MLSGNKRYHQLWNLPNHGRDYSESWKELAVINMNNGFPIGRHDFPETATKCFLEKFLLKQPISKGFSEIFSWVIKNSREIYNSNDIRLLVKTFQRSDDEFESIVKKFFRNMRDLLGEGSIKNQMPPDTLQYLSLVLNGIN